MTDLVDRRHAPRKKQYVDKRHDHYTTRKCTYRLLEDGKMVTITVSPKGKRMVTHKATVSQDQFDELWFSEFRHRFESDIAYQRRFKVRASRGGPRPRGNGRRPEMRSNGRGFGRTDRTSAPRSSRDSARRSNGRPYGNRDTHPRRPSRPNQRGYPEGHYTSDRGS